MYQIFCNEKIEILVLKFIKFKIIFFSYSIENIHLINIYLQITFQILKKICCLKIFTEYIISMNI